MGTRQGKVEGDPIREAGREENVADLGTKIQTGPTITSVMTKLGFRFERAPLHGTLKV